MLDHDAWKWYPQYRFNLFNKLWVADALGYLCGPCGIQIPAEGEYIVRPIYNLDGMGRGAYVSYLDREDESTPPGYFWCEYFEGEHYSVDYKQVDKNVWEPVLAVQGFRPSGKHKLYKFTRWVKLDRCPPKIIRPPQFVYDLQVEANYINIEYIDTYAIEVHLRTNPDFVNYDYDILDVVWESDVGKEPSIPNLIVSEEIIGNTSAVEDKRFGFIGKYKDKKNT